MTGRDAAIRLMKDVLDAGPECQESCWPGGPDDGLEWSRLDSFHLYRQLERERQGTPWWEEFHRSLQTDWPALRDEFNLRQQLGPQLTGVSGWMEPQAGLIQMVPWEDWTPP